MKSELFNQYLPWAIAALLAYLLSAVALWRAVSTKRSAVTTHPDNLSQAGNLANDTSNNKVSRTAIALALLALALHTATLLSSALKAGELNFSFFNSLSVTAWFTTILLMIVSLFRPVLTLGLIVFPTSALVVALAMAFNNPQSLTVAPQIQWHVLTSIVAYALLTMAAIQSILVSLQDQRLHAHRPGGLLRALPALTQMEQVLTQLLIASFVMLSLSLITGFVFLDDLFAQRLVHKTTLSILALILLAILLIGHFRFGWRGQKAARMTLGAYIALVLGYFGSKFVKELLLT